MNVNVYLILGLSFFVSVLAYDCDTTPCTDLESAKKCDKVRYCIDNVWIKQNTTGQRDSVCDVCLRMVKEARDTLRSNETREELKQVLEGSCNLLVLWQLKHWCNELMDKFAPELVEILSSEMDPETVCTVSKLCNNALTLIFDSNSVRCYRCQKFVQLSLSNMTSMTQETFQQELLYRCRTMGSFSDACSFYVTAYSNLLYGQLLEALKKNPCEVSFVCPSPLKKPYGPLFFREKLDKCGLCKSAANTLKTQLLRVKSAEDFKGVFVRTCKGLGFFEKGCDDLANVPSDELLYMYVKKFNPETICNLTYCSEFETDVPVEPLLLASEEFKETRSEPINFVSLLENVGSFIPDEDEEKEKTTAPSTTAVPMVIGPISLVNVEESEDCENCRSMFQILNLNVDSDESYVKNVFASGCKETDNTKRCQTFLKLFSQYLKLMFNSHLTAEKMCPELVSSCEIETPISASKDLLEGSCSFCKKTFQSLRSGFSADEPRAKLGESFVKVCDELPKIAHLDCNEFISVLVNKTLPKVATEYSDDETCSYLKLCPAAPEPTNSEQEVVVVEKDAEVKNNACEICMLVLQTVLDQLKSKESEDEIKKALNSVCTIVPNKFKPKCQKMVKEYGDQIVQMVLDNLSPATMCAELNFCDTSQQNLLNVPLLPGLPVAPTPIVETVEDKNGCRLCLMVVRMLIDQLQNDKTEDDIRKAITGICKYFPEETRDTCKNLIGEYTEDLIDMLIADFNETEICTFLRVCGPKQMTELSWYKNPRPVFKTFDIATNEVKETNNPEEICRHCRTLETSLEYLSDKNKTAESMLGFLIETCIIDGSEQYAGCAEKVSKHLLPHGRTTLLNMEDICTTFEVCTGKSPKLDVRERNLAALHNNVQECAMCEALVEVISSHEGMLRKNYDFAGNANHICSIVPKKRKKLCVSLLISYGPSIVNLIVDQHVSPDDICYHLVLCDKSMQAKVSMVVSASEDEDNDCRKGPSFWCANEENAKKCQTYLHCRELVWANGKPPQ